MDITALGAVKALDGLFARQAAIANNIANVHSEGFTPSGVSFEAALRAALESGDVHAVRHSPVTTELQAAAASVTTDAKVRVDQEVAALSETGMNYTLLLSMLDRKLATQKLALSDGRGA
jgi:flagellar basal-body rod protein FlgB